MAKIIKFTGYIVDIEGDCDASDIKDVMDSEDYWTTHHITAEERDIEEWDDDHPLNRCGCSAEEYEKYFSDTETVKHAYNANEKYHAVDEFRCSECGIHIEDWTAFFEDEDDGEYTAEYEFRYCPNCGARMDGDKK